VSRHFFVYDFLIILALKFTYSPTMYMLRTLSVAVLTLLAFTGSGQSKIDIVSGYTFNYQDCSKGSKKKDPVSCASYTNYYYINGYKELVSESSLQYAVPGRGSKSTSKVNIMKLSWSDYTITKEVERAYTDSTLVLRDVWKLKLETTSHAPEVTGTFYSEILKEESKSSGGYLISLYFPTEEDAWEVKRQIWDLKEKLK